MTRGSVHTHPCAAPVYKVLTLMTLESYRALTVAPTGHVDARGAVHALVVVARVDVVLAVGPRVTIVTLAAVRVGAVNTPTPIQTGTVSTIIIVVPTVLSAKPWRTRAYVGVHIVVTDPGNTRVRQALVDVVLAHRAVESPRTDAAEPLGVILTRPSVLAGVRVAIVMVYLAVAPLVAGITDTLIRPMGVTTLAILALARSSKKALSALVNIYLTMATCESIARAVTLIVCVVSHRLTARVVLALVGRAGVHLGVASPPGVLGVTDAHEVIHQVPACAVDARVAAALINVGLTIFTFISGYTLTVV